MATGKGKKRTKNQPVFYDELKTRHNIIITPSSWLKLQISAKKQEVSVSEFIEQWAQKLDGD
ncbi:hypothetical protein [Scytonema sp. PRP1]|uniref:hypothetical protein n=1 Tax=Scytonema sp. PRP1 TaxID=3120513 RepID=UPI002FD1E5E7